MAEDTLLSEDLLRQLMSVGEADLLVAIPTYNNAGTIGQTIQAIEDSYQQNFVRDRVAILNVDGGSSDQTQEIVANLNGKKIRSGGASRRCRLYIGSPHNTGGTPSQGAAMKIVFCGRGLASRQGHVRWSRRQRRAWTRPGSRISCGPPIDRILLLLRRCIPAANFKACSREIFFIR